VRCWPWPVSALPPCAAVASRLPNRSSITSLKHHSSAGSSACTFVLVSSWHFFRNKTQDVKIQLLERSTVGVKTDVNYIRLTVDEIKRDLKEPAAR
jgi:hypothetical protein